MNSCWYQGNVPSPAPSTRSQWPSQASVFFLHMGTPGMSRKTLGKTMAKSPGNGKLWENDGTCMKILEHMENVREHIGKM